MVEFKYLGDLACFDATYNCEHYLRLAELGTMGFLVV